MERACGIAGRPVGDCASYRLGVEEAEMSSYSGHNGQVELRDDELVITRAGALARASVGNAPPRRIPIAAMAGVRVKDATRLTNGHVQFLIGDEGAPSVAATTAASVPNTVLFTRRQQDQFRELVERVEARITANRESGIDPASVDVQPAQGRQVRLAESKAGRESRSTETSTTPSAEPWEPPSAERTRPDRSEAKAEKKGARADAKAQKQEARAGAKAEREAKEAALAAERGKRLASFRGVTLFERVIVTPDGESPLAGTQATVDAAGQLMQTQRATLTRFALTGGLGAIAFKKKKNIDTRELYLLIDAPAVASAITCPPTEGAGARRFAAQVNSAAKVTATPEPAEGEAPAQEAPTSAGADVADQLRKFAQLHDEGILSDEEFQAQKAKLLGD
jgi:hypothetical protein